MQRRSFSDARRRQDRGVEPVIATVLLVAITVVLAAVLYSYLSVTTPNQQPTLAFEVKGFQNEQAWGDPTDCTNTTQYAHCNLLPAIFITITSHTPGAILLTNIQFYLRCNGTSLLTATLASMEIVPGSGASPNGSSPVLGKCGTWSPSTGGTGATYFNRLAFYEQLLPGKTTVQNGDVIVVYAHPAGDFCDRDGYCPDDDFHGAPLWCYSTPGLCTVLLYDMAAGGVVVGQVQLYGLAPL